MDNTDLLPPKEKKCKLTNTERKQIENNRAKALSLKAAKLTTRSQLTTSNSNGNTKTEIDASGKTTIKMYGEKYVDSGGGFLIEESIAVGGGGDNENDAVKDCDVQKQNDGYATKSIPIPAIYFVCIECNQQFAQSYLMQNYDYRCCDSCRCDEDKHSLITKTEAKKEYLLKDCDLDRREPPLRYLLRKNPHNVRWGEMRLYLRLQVNQRALEVWGTEYEVMKEREIRNEKREKTKLRKYNKHLKQLRMEVRSSLFDRTSSGTHEHEYGPEEYNKEDDNYSHECNTCGLSETYEKM